IDAAARLARAGGVNAMLVGRQVAATRRRLARVAAVHRSRALVAREPAPPPARSVRRAPAALRTKPTITGTLGIRRADGDGFRLEWDAMPAVTEWEVRFSERADARADYVESDALLLLGEATSVEVPLGDNAVRVHIIGRGRGGR